MKLKDFDFRIWDNTNKEYIEEIEIHKFQNYPIEAGCTFMETDRIVEVEFIKNKNDLEIELFTGFYDKNGTKIYENDIIKNESLEEIYYVTRDDTNKMFKIVMYNEDSNGKFYRRKAEPDISFLKSLKSEKNMEVIGNIHNREGILKELK
ncbi:hypothetical protein [Campylobacter phage vB_Cj_QDYZ]|uniref:YopX protein domain-containing protein n=1 Tax=Campylobacter phage vB_Cj_QDYZ TaxID=3032374 RepID=A0AAF0GEB8_9CAUD|nr:hypothetical protein [Campylobacter phage CP39]WGA02290.1 hypothetical protein [Campylobacter phage vB_Cj_QDYZ]